MAVLTFSITKADTNMKNLLLFLEKMHTAKVNFLNNINIDKKNPNNKQRECSPFLSSQVMQIILIFSSYVQ